MPVSASVILAVNGGSSSIKFSAFTSAASRLLSGEVERVGTKDAALAIKDGATGKPETVAVQGSAFAGAISSILACLAARLATSTVTGIGHRIVHGGVRLTDNQPITPDLVAELRRTQPIDLAHLPREIALIEAFAKAFPGVPQVACFDTAFHRDLPRVAQILPIPRRYYDAGVRKLGFHGLSYTYLMAELVRIAGPDAPAGRVILAHLGSGASMAAVRAGKPIDTTMAFTPTSGLVMGTRPGDIDPGLLVYLMRETKLPSAEFDKFINESCGLLGLSETSSDMRDLLAARATDPRAADAVAAFCYQAKKQLCALVATLGGLDTLVFSGGIGEHAPEVRAEICEGLDFLGLHLDPAKNARKSDVISSDSSSVTIRVIPTDEEITIARVVGSFVADRVQRGIPAAPQ